MPACDGRSGRCEGISAGRPTARAGRAMGRVVGGLLGGLGASGRACACVLRSTASRVSAIGRRPGGAQSVSMTHVTHASMCILSAHAWYIIFTHLEVPGKRLRARRRPGWRGDVGPTSESDR